ncbi:periplasmic mercury ion-binding protein [Escherichia coli]|nr:periplasmic mercury ion-binding protein [Escherichia coli]
MWAATQTVTLAVPGMTCAACPITVKKAPPGRRREQGRCGLREARGRRHFDDTKASVQKLTKATADAGYPSSVKQ